MNLYTLFAPLLLLTGSMGVWINTDGERVEVPCPPASEYGSRTRLPAGCRAEVAGVWLSVERYRELEINLAKREADLEAQATIVQELKSQINSCQSQLLVCMAAPPCPSCPSAFVPLTQGALLGSLITSGGCVAWTLFK